MTDNSIFYSAYGSLLKKLEERDETIEMLRHELKIVKSKLGYKDE